MLFPPPMKDLALSNAERRTSFAWPLFVAAAPPAPPGAGRLAGDTSRGVPCRARRASTSRCSRSSAANLALETATALSADASAASSPLWSISSTNAAARPPRVGDPRSGWRKFSAARPPPPPPSVRRDDDSAAAAALCWCGAPPLQKAPVVVGAGLYTPLARRDTAAMTRMQK